MGDNMWGFMGSGVVPDIVTMGKPMGDGHPIAIVVTTPEIAAAFAQETDYFNAFGGNPVSATAGKATLEVVQRENLLANVKTSGDHLLAGFARLAKKYELIGDIRGKGLYLAIELVRDRMTKEPADCEASQVIELMKQSGVLISRVGQHRNTLKIRPPLILNTKHADIALQSLDSALSQVGS